MDDIATGGRDDVSVNHGAAGQDERDEIDLAVLSDREREVLDLALAGLSAKAIADRLTLSQATIRSHLSRIYGKVGVGGRVELLANLNSRQSRPASPPPVTPADPAPPRRARPWPLAASLAMALLAVIAGASFLLLRPDLPPSTDLATVSRLIDQRQVASLDLRGDTLFVTTADGRHYRVAGVDGATLDAMASRANANTGATVEVSIAKDDTPTPASFAVLVSAFGPLILLLSVSLVVFRRLRRPPQLRPAS